MHRAIRKLHNNISWISSAYNVLIRDDVLSRD